MIDKGRYRKVSVRMWGDEKFKTLTRPKPNAQTLWLFLLTGPHTSVVPGLFVAGEAGLAETLGWSLASFRTCFKEIAGKGMAVADWKARVVFLPKSVTYNPPESPNVIRAWRSALEEVPECELKYRAAGVIRGYVEGLPQGFARTLGEGWPSKAYPMSLFEPLPNQEQEQEQEQEQDRPAAPPTPAKTQADEDREIGTHAFLRRFCELYSQYRHGARFHVTGSKHVPMVRALLRTFGLERLEKLTVVMLNADDDWINQTDRGLEVLHTKVNWCEAKLAAHEQRKAGLRVVS